MAVKLRLRRMGRKKRPYYRVVAADSRAPRDGRFIENVGTYEPLSTPYQVDLVEDRIFYWLGNGAQPTRTVRNLLEKKGLWLKWDMMKKGVAEDKIAEALVDFFAAQEKRENKKAENEARKAAQNAKASQKAEAEEAEAAEVPEEEKAEDKAEEVEVKSEEKSEEKAE